MCECELYMQLICSSSFRTGVVVMTANNVRKQIFAWPIDFKYTWLDAFSRGTGGWPNYRNLCMPRNLFACFSRILHYIRKKEGGHHMTTTHKFQDQPNTFVLLRLSHIHIHTTAHCREKKREKFTFYHQKFTPHRWTVCFCIKKSLIIAC